MKRIDVRHFLATGLLAALPGLAAGAEATSSTEDLDELTPIVVTGSHIPTIQTEGPSPVTTITAADMESRGFTTVQQAINSLTQITGTAQNETMSGAFTQNANSIELRDLGPGHTLVLVDGRRVADYPLPYNGQSNFVNISTFPAAAVDHIELLSSGASAIYGSDAVAGVVNIVLKKKLDTPFNVDLEVGDTTQGGGKSLRAQLVTGFEAGRLNMLFAAEVYDRQPVYAFQRSFQDSAADNPDPTGRFPSRAVLRLDAYEGTYIDPGEHACDAFPNLPYSERPGFGNYCGQSDALAQYTLQNARSRASLFSRGTYTLDHAEIYGSLSMYGSSDRYDPNFAYLSSDYLFPEGGFFDVSPSAQAVDQEGFGGVFSTMQRYFQTYEIGSYKAAQNRDHEQVMDYSGGIRGDMAGDWRYDLTLAGSHYEYHEFARALLNQPLIDYYFGKQLTDGSGAPLTDPVFNYYPVYNVDWSKVYQPISPATYDSFTAPNDTRAQSDSKTATLVFNGSLFDLPAGPVSAAVVLEGARQSYGIDLNPQLVAGDFFALTGSGGGGERKRYASGLELSVPVFDPLRLQLAGRYDRYDDITKVNGAFTYNLGLEYRPIKQVLLRGSYATSFRAPDMHYVFADPSGFFTDATDEYLCRRDEPNVSLAACTTLSGTGIQGARQGNPYLVEETSKSFTYGIVVQPLHDLTVTVDYYSVRLKNGVQDDSVETLLQTEADCRLGVTKGGEPKDINSLECQAALAHVKRHPADGTNQSEFIEEVIVGPINASRLETRGIDASLHYLLSLSGFGKFDFTANYTTVLSYKTQQFAGDPVKDELKDLEYFGWHSRMSGGVTWTLGQVTSSLFVERYGSTPNWAETGRLGSWPVTNLTARYNGLMGGEAYIGFAVDNLLDRKPPRDPTYNEYPYYSSGNYDPIGRQVFLQVGTHF